ncbi:LCCL domain protein [Talaromyces stipitatus ATCC 10500]|uniref:LCCL domain protein n=1 Tax=Talaromyces stipitatus (strain ATCC 10500 / CBS 375.48 / QM 6759 / NRRL 1006) TaxID=441959 RepID=B8MBL2_TALSN|nr:LCCL domain protein [Talaromyces stipitatus ATCC 10500]EED17876.1 LCCL domain protein [Talaromyces stipitatus ATCC 10500]
MIRDQRDEERGIYVAPPLTDDGIEDEDLDNPVTHVLNVETNHHGHDGTSFRMPVWLRESSSSFQWRWIPLPLRKAGRVTARWVKGPDPPHDLLFQPLFPKIQEIPVKFFDRYAPRKAHKVALLLLVYFLWLLPWFLIILKANTSGNIEDYGRPQVISCAASYWAAGNRCGLNGNECRPFDASHLAFRCPGNCKSVILQQERTVGNQTLNYQSLVVGGPEPDSSELGIYRADSFICQAAIHAGVVSDSSGGCGVLKLNGAGHSFPSSTRNGITSTGFPSTFPKSFYFLSLSDSQNSCPADPRWPLLGITAASVAIISIFTLSPGVFYFSTFSMLILHVGVVSDPPYFPSLAELFSILLSRLLPACFIAYVLYLYAARPLLQRVAHPGYQIEKSILYLTPAFIGALNNYTFALWIPLQRLTPHDLANQPGAKVALATVVSIIIVIVLSQAWLIRQAGLMPRYLKVYLSFVAILLFLLALPGLRLRIHHYILAMLLMPGTIIPTRASFIYQGLLLGLFVNGVARWGFASIIETPAALGEDPTGPGGWWGASYPNITNASVSIHLDKASPMHPIFYNNAIGSGSGSAYRGNGNITFHLWERQRMEHLGVDGISVLLNDVERWRGYLDEDRKGKFTWRRQGHRGLELVNYSDDLNLQDVDSGDESDDDMVSFTVQKDELHRRSSITEQAKDENEDEPQDLFFRFAFLKGSEAGHYGGAGVWLRDGRWIDPPPQQKRGS